MGFGLLLQSSTLSIIVVILPHELSHIYHIIPKDNTILLILFPIYRIVRVRGFLSKRYGYGVFLNFISLPKNI